MKLTISRLLMAVLIVFFYACGGNESGHSHEDGADHHEHEEGHVEAQTKGSITLSALTGSPDFPTAKLSLTTNPEVSADGTHTLKFDVSNYELGAQTTQPAPLANSAKGQHIHFIVDNGPYSAHYEPTVETDKLSEDGNHVILAFLSRSYHESVKNNTSFVVTQVKTGDSDAPEADLSATHMFYSRPKGIYKGEDTKKLLLDFFLLNVDGGLSKDGYKVRAKINGEEFILTDWVPYIIEGLPMGEVSISLDLLDAAGEVVPGPFNSVTRTVTLAPADAS